MAETKRKLPVFGLEVDVSEVPITKTDEYVNKYTLEDGTVLRVKSVATAALRVDGQYMPDGSPIYIILASPVTSVESSPLSKVENKAVSAEKAQKGNN
jgi:hypothetical protein